MRGIEERWTTLRLGSVELVKEMHDAVIGGEKIGAWSRTLPHIMHAKLYHSHFSKTHFSFHIT